ncbi:hypothetical protein ACNAW0_10975 [Micromonospora sp. SL1-18]|uniref:hypothetical protein n=1 Tax=Micromonospora sp. SL1-18 TaxID=3399128 RepID=UPI003A4D3DB0
MRAGRRVMGAIAAMAMVSGLLTAASQPAAAAEVISLDSPVMGARITPGPVLVAGRLERMDPGDTVSVSFTGSPGQEWIATPGPDGRWSVSVDTAGVPDGVYQFSADVPSSFGGTAWAARMVYVDEVADDIVIDTPASGATISTSGEEGIRFTGHVPDVGRSLEPGTYLTAHLDGDQIRSGGPVAWLGEDGRFSFGIPTRYLSNGAHRIGVGPDCLITPNCPPVLATVDIVVGLTSSVQVTDPTAGQVFDSPFRMGIGVTVDNPGPVDAVSATIDNQIPVGFSSPMKISATRTLWWGNPDISSMQVPEGLHTLRVSATARGRTIVPPDVRFVVDFTAPTSASVAVPAAVQLTNSVAVSWTGVDNVAVANYDVRYRTSSASSGVSAYVYPAALQRTSAKRTTLAATAGYRYCFSARARDYANRTSAWSAETCTMTPYDDRWLAVSKGSVRGTSGSYYRGTYTKLAPKGKASHAVTGRRFGIVARTCPTCGEVTVSVAGVTIGKINLKRSTTGRAVLWLPTRPGQMSGTMVIKSNNNRTVIIDGVVVQR